MRRLVMAVLLPTAIALSPAKGGEPPQLPPPPEPWHNDAYIGFERIAEMGPAEDEGQWYWQNALQVDGTRVKLHKQIVVCREGRVRSAEGDGGAEFFVGSLEGTPKQRTVSLRSEMRGMRASPKAIGAASGIPPACSRHHPHGRRRLQQEGRAVSGAMPRRHQSGERAVISDVRFWPLADIRPDPHGRC
jgi:hypothetical protein